MTPTKSYTTRLSSKGQLVVPAPVRKSLGLEPGEQLVVRQTEAGFEVRRAEPRLAPPEEVQAALDRLGREVNYTGPTIPLEQLGIGGIDYADAYPDDPECRGDSD